ncbi:MAG: PQQ-binding-like beta-propeller repeat protein, partial [Myxococcales bacterium]|nr:PQQ-binding-like beta-propeller repeat protein [Myxococcales bacterium]
LQWVRKERPGTHDKRGFSGLDTASPVVHDDLLVIAHHDVVGFDRRTGAERWRVPGYTDFGSPAVVATDGAPVVVLPDGRVVDGGTGEVAVARLPPVAFSTPHVHDDTVVVGGSAKGQPGPGDNTVGAFRVGRGPAGLTVQPLWHTVIGDGLRFFAAPVTTDSKVVAVSHRGRAHVLDLQTGVHEHAHDVHGIHGEVVGGVLVVGDDLWVSDDQGHVVRVGIDALGHTTGLATSVGNRSGPWPLADGLVAMGAGKVERWRW